METSPRQRIFVVIILKYILVTGINSRLDLFEVVCHTVIYMELSYFIIYRCECCPPSVYFELSSLLLWYMLYGVVSHLYSYMINGVSSRNYRL